MSEWKTLWTRWKAFARRLGELQSKLLLSLLYALGLTPFALIAKIFLDPLGLKKNSSPAWRRSKTNPQDSLEESRRQF